MVEERRRHIRWSTKIRVAYSLGEDDPYEEIFTEDISFEGLQMLVVDDLRISQIIRIKVEFVHDSVPIISKAEVVNIKKADQGFRVGVKFLDMDSFQQERLKRALGVVVRDFEQDNQ